jgi:hypothetical protein
MPARDLYHEAVKNALTTNASNRGGITAIPIARGPSKPMPRTVPQR